MTEFPSTAGLALRGTGQLLRALGAIPGLLSLDHRPQPTSALPSDLIGVNVAPGKDPALDDYIVEQLRYVGLEQVRMDYSYDSPGGPAQRLLERLLAEGFGVFLKVIPPLDQAQALSTDKEAQAQWRGFLATCFDQYGDRVQAFEIGATPNRGRWSGFSAHAFLVAWHCALAQAGERHLVLAGPNVSDFEPLYNLAFLGLMRKLGSAPQVHTDNLFVERVVEPEAFDHRVLGRAMTGLARLNLVKKSRVLAAIGSRFGADRLVCTYTCWTSKRLARRNPWPERKGANYMLRYLLLAVASNSLERIYWGPLICSRDGLIHDKGGDYPQIDQVSFYEAVRGDIDTLTPTPALHTLRLSRELLANASIHSFRHDPEGISLAVLGKPQGHWHYIAWCRDGMNWPLAELLDTSRADSFSCRDVFGNAIPVPATVGESPLIIDSSRADLFNGAKWPGSEQLKLTTHLDLPELTSTRLEDQQWPGAILLRRDHQQADLALGNSLHPDKLRSYPELAVLRDARNRIWNISDPRHQQRQLSVKLNRVKGIKRITYRFRPSKGRRHWNNACKMLRHGIQTPTPVAYFEQKKNSGISDSWYICEFIPGAFSSREVYAALRDGQADYRGLDKAAWFDLLAGFVGRMHNMQIIHRDLSAGNLLLRQLEDGQVEPMLIDIGRAAIWTGPGSRVKARHRLRDLMRICYKLNWEDREDFVRRYQHLAGAKLGRWWRLPFHYYDYKQRFKKAIKGKGKKRRR